MNYINKAINGQVSIFINTRLNDVDIVNLPIEWTMTKDGDDDSSVSFTTPSTNFNGVSSTYYHKLDLNFYAASIVLDNNTHYVLEGYYTTEIKTTLIYSGKVFVTDTPYEDYSVNKDKYTEKTSTNNYLILE